MQLLRPSVSQNAVSEAVESEQSQRCRQTEAHLALDPVLLLGQAAQHAAAARLAGVRGARLSAQVADVLLALVRQGEVQPGQHSSRRSKSDPPNSKQSL